jgi:hypothetical protein
METAKTLEAIVTKDGLNVPVPRSSDESEDDVSVEVVGSIGLVGSVEVVESVAVSPSPRKRDVGMGGSVGEWIPGPKVCSLCPNPNAIG